ncbi:MULTISPECIES: type IV pilin protein [unclassified Agarivorans]|uniref:type IV pilin protein n=1 Tax=unclassified Agarivorans TaxID=2636026 RepID=UPI003D7D84F0
MSRAMRGVTLIELMIAVAIVAILAAVAYPAYTSFVAESRRNEAKKELSTLAVLQEQYYADNASYASSLAALGLTAAGVTTYNSESAYYTISLTASAAASTYTVKATAIGSQLNADSDCRSFTINEQGAKAAVNASGSSNPECW